MRNARKRRILTGLRPRWTENPWDAICLSDLIGRTIETRTTQLIEHGIIAEYRELCHGMSIHFIPATLKRYARASKVTVACAVQPVVVLPRCGMTCNFDGDICWIDTENETTIVIRLPGHLTDFHNEPGVRLPDEDDLVDFHPELACSGRMRLLDLVEQRGTRVR